MKSLLFLLLLNWTICNGQNLISNGGFETYDSLPYREAQFQFAKGWNNCNGLGSPDYFHMNGFEWAKLPYCYAARVFPHSGNAIMGLFTWDSTLQNAREYISQRLNRDLEIGKNYKISFYLTSGQYWNWLEGICGSNNLSVAFSTIPLVQKERTPIKNIKPQYVMQEIFYDTAWQQISFVFKAKQSYKYITIGNFYDNLSTKGQVFITGNFNYAYYFLDDISVSLIDSIIMDNCDNSIIEVYPNPFSELLNINLDCDNENEVILYDALARKILHESFAYSKELLTEKLADGIYFYVVKNKMDIVKKGKLFKY